MVTISVGKLFAYEITGPKEIAVQRDQTQEANALKPVDPFALLERLSLTTGKAAEFCGVSRRQLCYWTDIGLVTASNEDEEDDSDDDTSSRRVYDFPALYKIMLIKQVLAKVRSLRRAAKEINNFLQQREHEAEDLRASIDKKREEFLSEQSDKLEDLATRSKERMARLNERDEILCLIEGLSPLSQLGRAVSEGDIILEEDPSSCLRLASLIEQLDARLESLPSA